MQRYDELLFNRFNEDWSKLTPAQLLSLLSVKTQITLPAKIEPDMLKDKLNIKLGIDPTGADIHIGHLCPIFVLNIFLKCGHHVDFIIGDFTAKIGDPSGRNTERAMITDEQIAKNFATYVQQIAPYIDTKKLNIHKNSQWLSKMSLAEFLGVLQRIKLSVATQREDFRKRIENVSLAEVNYAVLMGMDSVNLHTNIELGGLDQILNFSQCRMVQEIYHQKPEMAFGTPILEGLSGDGRKMSKSYNNYIAVTAPADDKFGKFMSLPDNLLLKYYQAFGYLYAEEIPALKKFIAENPLEAKKQLATYFVSLDGNDLNIGRTERENFERKFSKRELTDNDFITVKVAPNTPLLNAIAATGKFASNAEIKRLILAGAVSNIDTKEKLSLDYKVTKTVKIKVGKLNIFKMEV
ncbi:MAG: tyrosine--tRNA ligase [Eubacteriales bacterium]|nr:tyrosine--tRNA ligase [Eubacteriales bacterium]